MTHAEFQQQVAIKLLQNPELFGRKKVSSISISSTVKTLTMPSEHRLIKMSKKGYCIACKITQERPAKRQALAEIDGNEKKRRKRGSQSWYACAGCVGGYCCQKKDCFDALHS